MRCRLPVSACLILAFCATASAENVIWLEAEQFDRGGGWTNDAQFIDQMGSPYLMAIGLGEPVDDAATTVAVPAPGKYRLWARTRDWVPEYHPGRFQIVLDGQAVAHVFGQSGKSGWQWEDGGVQVIEKLAEIRLRDLTGYYARCDCLVLTDDLDWKPPAEVDAIAALREKYGGVSRGVEDAGEYDVVVVGGGLAGCMAAVSAARMGADTVLIQNRPMLGGNASLEILVPPVGVWPYGQQDPLDPRETGLVEEIRTLGTQKISEGKLYTGRLTRLVRAEPNLDLFLNTHATGVEMRSAGEIAAVLAVDVRTGKRMRFAGKVFVDCTGDGSIGVWAGAEYRHGKEPRSIYGESMAPEKPSRQTMGNSLKYASTATGKPQPFETPPWAMPFRKPEDFPPGRYPRLGGDIGWQWMLELGGTRDTYADAEEIRDDLLRLIYGIWGYVKNHSEKLRDKAADHKLVWVGHVAGKRENRRLIGDYVLNQNDLAGQTLFPDRVAYGGWGIDDHYSEGFFYDGPPAQHGYKGVLFSIPFRSLYSKNIDNLLMAGRDISASHVAMGATRVMLTCAVMGEASGTAAAICVERDSSPREVYERYLEELQQQLLKDGAHIIDLPNRDPRDLAPAATVTASSERKLETGEVMAAANVTDGFARAEHGKRHAWGPDLAGSAAHWLELAWDGPRTSNVVHVSFQTKNHAPENFAIEVRAGDGWQELARVTGCTHRRYVLGLKRTTASRLRVLLEPGSRREVGICEVRVYDEPQRLVEMARRVARVMDQPDDIPYLPWSPGIDPRKLPGIVIDASQAERVGRWVPSEFTGPYILDGYLHDGNAEKGKKSLRFTAKVPKAGTYDVRFAYVAYENRATNVPVTVRTPTGAETTRIDQRTEPPIDGLFLSLGKFHLDAGETVAVEITNAGTDGYVVVDAVQLVPGEP